SPRWTHRGFGTLWRATSARRPATGPPAKPQRAAVNHSNLGRLRAHLLDRRLRRNLGTARQHRECNTPAAISPTASKNQQFLRLPAREPAAKNPSGAIIDKPLGCRLTLHGSSVPCQKEEQNQRVSAGYSAPSRRSATTSASSRPSQLPSTSSVCSPSTG